MKYRITSWPHFSNQSPNPYQKLFYQALEPYGVEVLCDFPLSNEALRTRRDEVDAIHFHWPEGAWRWTGRSRLQQAKGLIGFRKFLREAKRLGIKLIWTVHNHEHHEGASWSDQQGYRLLARHCDLVICHSEWSRKIVQAQLSPKNMVVMYHGNYGDTYPDPRPRNQVMSELGLSAERPTFCCLGLIRGYKNFELAAEAIADHFKEAQLIVAGSPHRDHSMVSLEELASRCDRIKLIPRRISDQEFADYASASEAMILPYQRITGSGVLLAAWSLGTSVVVPELPFFRELCELAPGSSEFFESNNAISLRDALQRFLQVPQSKRSESIDKIKESFQWNHCIQTVTDVLVPWIEATKEDRRSIYSQATN